MASRKPFVIDLAVRTLSAQLNYQKRPRFRDTTLTAGEWRDYQVEAQFDTAYLHGLAGPFWVRFELRGAGPTHSIALYPDGRIAMVPGIAKISPQRTALFEFTTDAQLEQILHRVGQLIATWEPETESA